MREVLTDLRSTIHDALTKPLDPKQLELWGKNERDQYQRDVDALRARAEAVPDEIEREGQAIRDRYATQAIGMFPAAVTFLVPRRLADRGLKEALGD